MGRGLPTSINRHFRVAFSESPVSSTFNRHCGASLQRSNNQASAFLHDQMPPTTNSPTLPPQSTERLYLRRFQRKRPPTIDKACEPPRVPAHPHLQTINTTSILRPPIPIVYGTLPRLVHARRLRCRQRRRHDARHLDRRIRRIAHDPPVRLRPIDLRALELPTTHRVPQPVHDELREPDRALAPVARGPRDLLDRLPRIVEPIGRSLVLRKELLEELADEHALPFGVELRPRDVELNEVHLVDVEVVLVRYAREQRIGHPDPADHGRHDGAPFLEPAPELRVVA